APFLADDNSYTMHYLQDRNWVRTDRISCTNSTLCLIPDKTHFGAHWTLVRTSGRLRFESSRGRRPMTRQEATEAIVKAKRESGITFEEIARAVGRHKVWTAAALLGQAT